MVIENSDQSWRRIKKWDVRAITVLLEEGSSG
jgi:hypothetical protein